jgi:hypothetical protein
MIEFQENRTTQDKNDYREETLKYFDFLIEGLRSKLFPKVKTENGLV